MAPLTALHYLGRLAPMHLLFLNQDQISVTNVWGTIKKCNSYLHYFHACNEGKKVRDSTVKKLCQVQGLNLQHSETAVLNCSLTHLYKLRPLLAAW